MSTSLSKFYRVRDDDTGRLKIIIGHGQIGKTSVSLDRNDLAVNEQGTVDLTIPGSGRDLKGRTLFCSTIVADVRTETNKTSVIYELTGGVANFEETLQESVDTEGGVMFYTATFRFYG
jgi:hypothetical protein